MSSSAVSLDSFQIIVAVYLFYVAIKGSGTMYRFQDISQADQQRVVKPLRIAYFVCGLLALAEGAASILQGDMFAVTVDAAGVETISQNYTLDAFPFITYHLLSVVEAVLVILIVVILGAVFLWLRSLRKNAK